MRLCPVYRGEPQPAARLPVVQCVFLHGRYIDAFIRKRGNPQRWQSGSMANGSGRSHAGLSASMAPEISRRPALVNSTVAAIASNARGVPESEDEDSERDEYWSGDDSDS